MLFNCRSWEAHEKVLTRVAFLYLQSLRSWRLPRQKLREAQGRKLLRTLREAYGHHPYYRAAFRKSGVSPGMFTGVESLHRFPVMSKADLIANYQGIRRLDVPTAFARTGSGTTGMGITMAWSAEQIDLNHALLSRRLTEAGVRPWTRIATIWPPSSAWSREQAGAREAVPTTTLLRRSSFSRIIRHLPSVRAFTTSFPVKDDEVEALSRYSPEFIQGNPSYLRRLGKRAQALRHKVRPRALICVNENFTRTVHQELGELYQSRVLNAIGSIEFGVVGSECAAESGMHLNEDYVLCEVLRHGMPVAPGEVGELVMTSLHNDVMPLIRYRTGDLVELGPTAKCSCGSSLMRIARVLGRTDEGLVTASGRRVLAIDVAERIETDTDLRDYQLVQTGVGRVTLRLAPGTALSSENVARVKDRLENYIGATVRIEVENREKDEVWKKYRPVVSMIGN